MMRTTVRGVWAILAVLGTASIIGACADVFGIEEVELKHSQADGATSGDAHPDNAAGGKAGSAGDASSEPDVSLPDGAGGDAGGDTKPDLSWDGDAKDVSVDPGDALEEEAEAEAGITCGPGTKLCSGQCALTNQPTTGCAQPDCQPCKFAFASSMCDGDLKCAVSQCVLGHEDCNGEPLDGCEAALKSDPGNCGTCGKACAYPNAQPQCVNGTCAMGWCDAGWTDCDASPLNGCEVHTDVDPLNCGACGNSCVFAHAQATCQAGGCVVAACSSGYADCDGLVSNGCEVNLQANPEHCGSCPIDCNPDGGFLICAAGNCEPTTCTGATGECDGNLATVCETDLNTALAHCGACGNTCQFANAEPACLVGVCHLDHCVAPYDNCDGNESNGCETNTTTSLLHCGSCSNSCQGGQNASATCVNGICGMQCYPGFGNCDGASATGCETDLQSTAQHCGACAAACPTRPNSTPLCSAGACGMSCNAGYADCDAVESNGCEVNLQSSATNCGACGQLCNGTNGTPACQAGSCAIACNPGFSDCDNSAATGCEIQTATDLGNCGACGTVCGAAHATPSCSSGACSEACHAGWGDCNGSAADGCETSLSTLANCAACGLPCSPQNATGNCTTGTCQIAACAAGYTDCDSQVGNGCETMLSTDVNNCGTCGYKCPTACTPLCTSGQCGCSSCPAGMADCDKNPGNGCEINTTNDAANCGVCSNVCTAPNATTSCASSLCGIAACNAGYGNCNGLYADGCERNLNTDPLNCGTCGAACSTNHATPTCNAGSCVLACEAGWGNCDGNVANGCEAQLNTNTNCGSCGQACSPANATGSCTTGVCQIAGCNAGFGNCDGNVANGCESNLNTDIAHCGSCPNACSFAHATAACTGGVCSIASCNSGWANCDGAAPNGCEVSLQTDMGNCGACGRACGTQNVLSRACSSGVCSSTCTLGFANCSLPATGADDGCELTVSTNSTNCGACANNCTVLGGGFVCGGGGRPANRCGCNSNGDCDTTYTSGFCLSTGQCRCSMVNCNYGELCRDNAGPDVCSCNGGAACAAGQTCCQTTPAGCKDLQTDAASCGACGRPCPPGFKCTAGACACNGNASCDAGSPGSCVGTACVCGSTTCIQGKRCLAGGICG
ncbi:MAG: hypothetical protein HY898_15025 [Deltaproteobacteria bacterium]|nr:hypothetical protein [Deltaproteobacteria bacterium]